jgi:hypothetical protein
MRRSARSAVVLAAFVAVVFAAAVPGSAFAARTRVILGNSLLSGPDLHLHVLSRPSTLRVTSADSAVRLTDIAWHGWGGAQATATSVGRTCGSGGDDGYVCESGPVAVTASRLVAFDGDRYYSRLVASSFPGYGPHEVALPAKAPSVATLSKYCDHFGITSAYRTSCAVMRRVERAFGDRCGAEHPSVPDPVSRCHLRVLGFDCRPSGDAYHPVHCRRRHARVTFQPAE